MNRAVFILLLLLPVVAGADTLKVESFNLSYDNPDDDINARPKRREMLITHIQSVKPDILALQEALAHQLSGCPEYQTLVLPGIVQPGS